MNGLSYGKISKMPKKNFGRTVVFCVLGVDNHIFPAEKNFFRQQFGNHITILNQDMFFKGSEIFFPRFLKNEFSNSGKISFIKT